MEECLKHGNTDSYYMELALRQAEEAYRRGEVPVGALLVKDGQVLVEEHNRREQLNNATAHAEMLVLSRAGKMLGGWRLSGTTIYVTLEPCPMCAGALVQARVERLVYGAADPKGGAAGTLYDIVRDARLNHRLSVTGGVLEDRCSALLQQFFKTKRGQA